MKSDSFSAFAKYRALTLSVCAMAVFVWFFKNITAYILISVVVSLIGGPIMRLFMRVGFWKTKMPASLAAGLTLGVLASLAATVATLIVPLFIAEAEALSRIDLHSAVDRLQRALGNLQPMFEYFISGEHENIDVFLVKQLQSIFNYANISSVANIVVFLLGNIFIAVFAILFISFFFLKEPDLFLRSILVIVPDEHVAKTRSVLKSAKGLLTRYFVGLVIECSVTMVLVSSGLYLLGLSLQQAAVIGFVSGIFNVIPYVGPFIACSFGASMGIAFAIEHQSSGLLQVMVANASIIAGVFMFNAIVTQPFIHSNSVKAHPLEIFLVILMAGSFAGVSGMILAIPSYTLFRIVAKEFFNKGKVIHELTKNI